MFRAVIVTRLFAVLLPPASSDNSPVFWPGTPQKRKTDGFSFFGSGVSRLRKKVDREDGRAVRPSTLFFLSIFTDDALKCVFYLPLLPSMVQHHPACWSSAMCPAPGRMHTGIVRHTQAPERSFWVFVFLLFLFCLSAVQVLEMKDDNVALSHERRREDRKNQILNLYDARQNVGRVL